VHPMGRSTPSIQHSGCGKQETANAHRADPPACGAFFLTHWTKSRSRVTSRPLGPACALRRSEDLGNRARTRRTRSVRTDQPQACLAGRLAGGPQSNVFRSETRSAKRSAMQIKILALCKRLRTLQSAHGLELYVPDRLCRSYGMRIRRRRLRLL